MRRTIVTAIVVGLLAGALSVPAEAKKKKKKVKPYVTNGSIAIGHPANYEADAGIVRAEFKQTCAIPQSQGTDGYVVEIPANYMKKPATVTAAGSPATGAYDLDMFFYSDTCSELGQAADIGDDQIGSMPAGTKYVLVNSWEPVGAGIEFTFTAKPGK
jgi:extracellular elastinolytic metalloproteinase